MGSSLPSYHMVSSRSRRRARRAQWRLANMLLNRRAQRGIAPLRPRIPTPTALHAMAAPACGGGSCCAACLRDTHRSVSLTWLSRSPGKVRIVEGWRMQPPPASRGVGPLRGDMRCPCGCACATSGAGDDGCAHAARHSRCGSCPCCPPLRCPSIWTRVIVDTLCVWCACASKSMSNVRVGLWV
jgi:hypothetical protein